MEKLNLEKFEGVDASGIQGDLIDVMYKLNEIIDWCNNNDKWKETYQPLEID